MLRAFSQYTYIALLALLVNNASAAEIPIFDVYEVSLSTTNTYANPYTEISLTATFSGPGKTITIPGFWDGGNTWKIRVAPTIVGDWTLTSVTSNDSQLNGQSVGTTFTARTATADEIANNEVLRHGFIRVSKTYKHSFEHYDGTPFFFMGDTQWERAIMATDGLRTDGNKLFQQYQYTHAHSRSKKGFTVAAMATFLANGGLGNEGASRPFTNPHTDEILNADFFKAADVRIAYMTSKNIRPMILLGSPDSGLTSNTTWIQRFTKYLVARYASYDVIWFGIKEFQEYSGGGISQIDAFGNTIEAHDPYGHPTSTHTITNSNASGTSALNNRAWLDFHSLQDRTITSTLYNFGKPIVISEAWYKCPELGSCVWGNFNDSELLGPNGIWAAALNGGWSAGYEYWASPRGDTNEIFANMDIPSINYHKYLKDFFLLTEFEKLIPHDELVTSGSAELMTQENNIGAITGNEFVAFLSGGGNVTINLSSTSGEMFVKWYNPSSGIYTESANITASSNHTFTAPTNTPWVLWLNAKNKSTTTQPPSPAPLPTIPTGINLSTTTKINMDDTNLRINVGGPDYVDNLGKLWKADYGFNSSNVTTTTSAISGTNNPTLYQSGRWDPQGGSELMYSIPLGTGSYSVTLHFAETFTANRKFDVAMEDNVVLPGLDIYAEVGFATALTKTVNIDVVDGVLNIEFRHIIENPVVRAIEIQRLP